MRERKIAYPSNHLAINNVVNQWSDNKWHPAVYPKELCEFFIKAFTKEEDIVLDMFSGSGTTAVACINTKRNYICMDTSEEYCIKARERVNKLTLNVC